MFEYLDEITGDGEFIVRAKTLDELLSESGKALVGLMYDTEKLSKNKRIEIEARGETPKELVYNWLTEILFLQDTENFFFKEFNVKVKFEGGEYRAEGMGYGQDGDPSLVESYVKAVTMHNFYVKETKHGWEARIVVDL